MGNTLNNITIGIPPSGCGKCSPVKKSPCKKQNSCDNSGNGKIEAVAMVEVTEIRTSKPTMEQLNFQGDQEEVDVVAFPGRTVSPRRSAQFSPLGPDTEEEEDAYVMVSPMEDSEASMMDDVRVSSPMRGSPVRSSPVRSSSVRGSPMEQLQDLISERQSSSPSMQMPRRSQSPPRQTLASLLNQRQSMSPRASGIDQELRQTLSPPSTGLPYIDRETGNQMIEKIVRVTEGLDPEMASQGIVAATNPSAGIATPRKFAEQTAGQVSYPLQQQLWNREISASPLVGGLGAGTNSLVQSSPVMRTVASEGGSPTAFGAAFGQPLASLASSLRP